MPKKIGKKLANLGHKMKSNEASFTSMAGSYASIGAKKLQIKAKQAKNRRLRGESTGGTSASLIASEHVRKRGKVK